MKVTFLLTKEGVRRVRASAAALALSLEGTVCQFLRGLARSRSAENDIRELMELSEASGGHSDGRRFNREEVQRYAE